ncbi:MAG: histidine phosphatase family protein [Sulfurifustis sp.]
MPTLYLVRHGRAAANWESDLDPGLDPSGHEQARAAAATLAPLGPLRLLVSPMARTRETAAPLAEAWRIAPIIEPRVSEIPSTALDLKARGRWLREIALRNWADLDPRLRTWRANVLTALNEATEDVVVVTHYIAINVAAGAATGNDRVVSFNPDYCSVTILRTTGKGLELVQHGAQGQTRVL